MATKEIQNPIEMLGEIEAFLMFRLMADEPNISGEEMRQIRDDVKFCLKANGVDTDFQPGKFN